MRISDFDWDEENFLHIARHAVTPEEVEEVCFSNSCCVERGRDNFYYATGRTETGRHLFVVFKFLGRGRARVITARDMDEREKSRFKRK